MNPGRLLAAATIAGLAAMAAIPASAPATLRVESTAKAGLVMGDKEGTESDSVALRLVTEGANQEWEVVIFGGVGITLEFGNGCRSVGFNTGRCARLAPKVTVNLLGGDDDFAVFGNTITDPLTINLGAGNDVMPAAGALRNGGSDTIQGGSGNDILRGADGNDVLNGSVGNDTLFLGVGADSADGGDGDDVIFLATQNRDETDQVNGGIGSDLAAYSEGFSPPSPDDRLTPLRIIEANLETLAGEKDTNENDVLRSIESYSGGASADIITGVLSSNNGTYRGGLSDDQLFGTSGNNKLIGGAGRDLLSGKAGNDTLNGKIGESVAEPDSPVDCGAGTGDHAIVDLKDAITVGCEDTDRSAIGEGPHVRLKFRRVVAVRGGRVSVRLSCPRALRHRCAGTLALRLGRARTPPTRYAIKAGRSRRVSLRLGGLRRRVGRRTVGQLVSLERGDIKGLKTTSRRIVLRG